METIALILAAGRGERAGGKVPKQYQMLGPYPMMELSIGVFARCVDRIALVINPQDVDHYAPLLKNQVDLILPPVAGGRTRQESVLKGLLAIEPLKPQKVLIHDAARPFVSDILVRQVMDALDEVAAVVPALPVVDTLRRGQDGWAAETVSREGLWRMQTPQGFHYDLILSAHQKFAGQSMTDDAALIEAMGKPVRLIEGEERNFKITSSEDYDMANRLILSNYETRMGQGFDVHAFSTDPKRPLWLCGVKVADTDGLEGHSDADAALHALTDALLGALGEGDIGQHFPPSDPQWKNASSDRFLAHACGLMHEQGGSIINVDLTIICERPKIGPHRAAMQKRIADILGIDETRVNVKATTTEGLGFTGRGEGIAAQASVVIQLMSE